MVESMHLVGSANQAVRMISPHCLLLGPLSLVGAVFGKIISLAGTDPTYSLAGADPRPFIGQFFGKNLCLVAADQEPIRVTTYDSSLGRTFAW